MFIKGIVQLRCNFSEKFIRYLAHIGSEVLKKMGSKSQSLVHINSSIVVSGTSRVRKMSRI